MADIFDQYDARNRDPEPDPVDLVNELDAVWSPDFDAYASGEIDLSQVRCASCGHAPCDCPEFGTPEFFARLDRRHGRKR